MENKFTYNQAFSRNIGILSNEEQEKIKGSKIAIAGMGGVGGIYLAALARLGVENFSISDSDTFELVNFNRQEGASMETIGKKKIEVMEAKAKLINPEIKTKIFRTEINEKNAGDFLDGATIYLDGIDFFNIRDRIAVFEQAQKMNIPAITAAPIGFGASLLTFMPDKMDFKKYFGINKKMSDEELAINFGLGLSPTLLQRKYYRPEKIDFKGKKAPSLGLSTLLCANLASTEVVKIILGKKIKPAPHSIHFDPFVRKLKKTYLIGGYKDPRQRIKKWIVTNRLKK